MDGWVGYISTDIMLINSLVYKSAMYEYSQEAQNHIIRGVHTSALWVNSCFSWFLLGG